MGPLSENIEKDLKIGRMFVLDEFFDLELYKRMLGFSGEGTKKILLQLIPVETEHRAFWEKFFGLKIGRLNWGRRLKLQVIVFLCRLFKDPAINLALEAIELNGIRKYLDIWDRYKDTSLGAAIRGILDDEFQHEDAIVSQMSVRNINPERIRGIFLGANDGLVEILGAVSGFFTAFRTLDMIIAASITVAVAGSISMGAGAYVAASSEREIELMHDRKRRYLKGGSAEAGHREKAISSALLVGISYIVGSLAPVLPVLFGARTVLASVIASGVFIMLVSFILAFLSGMDIKKRVFMNVVILGIAVGITSLIGHIAHQLLGI